MCLTCFVIMHVLFVRMLPSMPRGPQPCFPRTANFGGSRKARLRVPAVAVETLWHACIIFQVITDLHAACHAARARGEHAWDRIRPRLRAGSSLPSGSDACSMHIFACTLCCMTCNIVTDVHAAWHALTRGCRLARPELRAGSLNMRCTRRLTVSDD